MSPRDALIDDFLRRNGHTGAQRNKLAGDASFRRYERILSNGQSFMLMDAPPPKEDVRPFLHIARHLTAHGFSAPNILAEDTQHGFLLLEDLGTDSYTSLLSRTPEKAPELYRSAVEVLAELHDAPLPSPLPAYDDARLLQEPMLLPEWLLPLANKAASAPEATESYREIWRALLPAMHAVQPVLVLRDYHADNLMWLPKRKGTAKVGLLDFQDAVSGHPAYDLVSLLEDARRDVPRTLAEEMIAHYLTLRPHVDGEAFRTAYTLLGAQRNCKILGIFARLCVRDGKPHYLSYLPRVWGHVEHDLRHPALAGLKQWLDRYFPAEYRLNPPKA